MNSAALLLCAVLLVAVSAHAVDTSGYIACTATGQLTSNERDYDFGCSSYSPVISRTWISNSTVARTLSWPTFSTEACCDMVNVYVDGSMVATYKGLTPPASMVVPAGSTKVEFKQDGSGVSLGFKGQFRAGPPMIVATSGQSVSSSSVQAGGYVYFSLAHTEAGSNVSFAVTFNSYQGMQPPKTLLKATMPPTLESYTVSADAIAAGSHYTSFISLGNPSDSFVYYLGVFMYGTSASITVRPYWEYASDIFLPLTNGVMVKSTLTGANIRNYQLTVPAGTRKLTIEVSREVPGGACVVLVQHGSAPTATNFLHRLDTSVQNYFNVPIEYPNASTYKGPNPGNYLFSVRSAVSSGFLLKATW